MPELPEVERAIRSIRPRVIGRTIRRVRVLHPAVARGISPRQQRLLRGDHIRQIRRRGKHQLFALHSGRVLHVHFRMTGWWALGGVGERLPRYSRAVIEFRDGTALVLEDPRALGSIALYEVGEEPLLAVGFEPFDRRLTAKRFGELLRTRRAPIKAALMNQNLIAGLGNIYAAEALWRARINPFVTAEQLSADRAGRLLVAIRAVLRSASGSRYREGADRFAVYDRFGRACRRCDTRIDRASQAGRSTYYCPRCQSR